MFLKSHHVESLADMKKDVEGKVVVLVKSMHFLLVLLLLHCGCFDYCIVSVFYLVTHSLLYVMVVIVRPMGQLKDGESLVMHV